MDQLQKPRITEIQVRMDCNGCVQKIKRALHGINGIYDLYIDLPQQKITIVGCADPAKIVKAIKKTRKSAVICSHTEPAPEEPPAQGEEPPRTEGGTPPPVHSADTSTAEAAPPGDHHEAASPGDPSKNPPPKDAAAKPPSPEVAKPSTETADAATTRPAEPSRPKDVEEVHVVYHYPPDYGYRSYGHNISHGGYGGDHLRSYPSGSSFKPEPQPPLYRNNISHGGYHTPDQPDLTPYAARSYNTQRPSPYFSTQYEYIRPEPPIPPQYATTHNYHTHRPSPNLTQYEYIRPQPSPSPPPPPPPQLQPQYTHYSRPVHYSHEDFVYYNDGNSYSNGNVTSVFSDENPNSCTIV